MLYVLEQLERAAAVFGRIDDSRLESLQENAVRAKFYAVRIAFFGRETRCPEEKVLPSRVARGCKKKSDE